MAVAGGGSNRLPGDWLSLAQSHMEDGPQGLGRFLDDAAANGLTTPIQAQTYVQLLGLLTTRTIASATADLVKVILEHVRRDSDRYSTTNPAPVEGRLSTEKLRRDRSLTPATDRISYYDLFEQSMIRWCARPTNNEPEPSERGPVWSEVTQWIWDGARDQLLDGGAIYLCARYGLYELLQILVNDDILLSRVDRLQVIFLASPDAPYSPLGAAILYQHLACVQAIITADGAFEYANTALDVLMNDNRRAPFLHSILNITRHALGMKQADPATMLPKLESILDFLIVTGYTLLENCTLLTRLDSEGKSPYQRAKEQRSFLGGDRIVTYLRRKIFEQFRDPDEVRMALYGNGDECNELGIELSDFNYAKHQFEIFVDDLERAQRENLQLLHFEDTLLYLHLPQLPQHPRQPHLQPTDLMRRFLTWLSNSGVKTIMELKLPDCWAQYELEFVVSDILGSFDVYELDWVRMDADIGGLAWSCQARPDTARIQSLRKLKIYQEKLPAQTLPFLSAPAPWLLEINHILINAVCTSTVQRDAGLGQMTFNPILTSYNVPPELEAGEVLSLTRFRSEPRTFTVREDSSGPAIAKDLTACHEFLSAVRRLQSRLEQLDRDGRPLPRTPAKTRRCLQVMRQSRVKIAIIDNGIDMSQYGLVENIVGGASFVRYGGANGTSYLPWYAAAGAHGTQMAFLAQSINPWCEIYALRVGSLQADIDDKAAAQAVEWAIAKGIDIISISWVIEKDNVSLTAAIKRAAQIHNTLIFCATADVGKHPPKRLSPARWKDYVIAVSAASRFDTPLDRSCYNVNVMLRGEKVTTSGPNYMPDIPAEITGSSAATALAAGLASLCLFLARMANTEENAVRFKERSVMLAVLSEMLPPTAPSDSRILEPALFFGTGFKLSDDFDDGTKLPPTTGLNKLLWSDNLLEKAGRLAGIW